LKKQPLVTWMGAVLLGVAGLYSAGVAAEGRIGVVRMGKVLEEAPQADEARKKLEKEFAARERELMSQKKSLENLVDQVSKEAASLSESERSSRELEIRKKQKQLKRDQDEFREEMTVRQNELLGKVQKDIVEAIQSVAKAKEFDLVLMGQAVVYFNDKFDITADVLSQLKIGGKRGGGGAASAPAPAPAAGGGGAAE
jgi:outer membrane protein